MPQLTFLSLGHDFNTCRLLRFQPLSRAIKAPLVLAPKWGYFSPRKSFVSFKTGNTNPNQEGVFSACFWNPKKKIISSGERSSNVAKILQRESQKGLDVGPRSLSTLGKISASLVSRPADKQRYGLGIYAAPPASCFASSYSSDSTSSARDRGTYDEIITKQKFRLLKRHLLFHAPLGILFFATCVPLQCLVSHVRGHVTTANAVYPVSLSRIMDIISVTN